MNTIHIKKLYLKAADSTRNLATEIMVSELMSLDNSSFIRKWMKVPSAWTYAIGNLK